MTLSTGIADITEDGKIQNQRPRQRTEVCGLLPSFLEDPGTEMLLQVRLHFALHSRFTTGARTL